MCNSSRGVGRMLASRSNCAAHGSEYMGCWRRRACVLLQSCVQGSMCVGRIWVQLTRLSMCAVGELEHVC